MDSRASRSRTSVNDADDATSNSSSSEKDMGPGSLEFFGKSPEAAHARKIYLRTFGVGTLSVIIMIFTLLPIYWGALWKTPERNLEGWVVDFDGGVVGEQVLNALAASANGGLGKVTWEVRSAGSFPGGVEDVRTSVRGEDTWAAIVVSPGTSERLARALTAADPTYDGSGAIRAFGVEARSENAYRGLIRPSIEAALSVITRRISLGVATRAATTVGAGDGGEGRLAEILRVSPQTIVTPVGFVLENLIPFDQPVATAATFVGMLYQLIMGFFVVMVCMAAREMSGYERRLSTRALIGLRLGSAFVAYFFISLFYSSMNMAFQLDVTKKYGSGGFVVFWMMNFAGLAAMCMALEAMITLLTPKGIPFFMLTWIITNLSVAIFPIEVLPGVFKYGYAWPFYNTAQGLRTIIFGTQDHLGRSFGILYAWAVLSCLTMSLFQWIQRRPKKDAPKEIGESRTDTMVEKPSATKEEA